MKVIEKLKSRVTVILIAHRLSTITYADKIFILEGGKVLAEGKHDYLMETCEYYNELYNNSKSKI
jgi:ATP-binding cassette subfamily B protein